jgi:hypothetical protein
LARQQLRLPGFQQKPPKGGGVETGRGRKSKKTGWRLTLGLKETLFAGIGVVGLMMMSFALGALAGRGDIYRAAYSWGLMSPARSRIVQWAPGMGPGVPARANQVPMAAPRQVAASGAKAPRAVAARKAKPGVVTGSITGLGAPVPAPTAKKKGTRDSFHKTHKTREEELRQTRREVVPKLKFLNSFDNPPKPKGHEKALTKSQTRQVRVAQYRSSREARVKAAELRKKGFKATIKKTRGSRGTFYVVYKTEVIHHETGRLARKPGKRGGLAKRR